MPHPPTAVFPADRPAMASEPRTRSGFMRIDFVPIVGVAVAVVVGLVLAGGGLVRSGPPDTDAFWNAAMRLRDGTALYPAIDPNADEVYRYAPWFAWLWTPLTYLPKAAVYASWNAVLAGCAAFTVLPLLRRGWSGHALAALAFGALMYAAGYGNPTPLITAALVASRMNAVALGIAGSLKVYPLLLLLGYVGERRFRDAFVSLAVAGLLWAPAAVYGLDNYVTSPGNGGVSLWGTAPLLWLIGAGASVAGTIWLASRQSRWTWVGAAACILLAVPRIWPGELAYIAVIAITAHQSEQARPATTARQPSPWTEMPARQQTKPV